MAGIISMADGVPTFPFVAAFLAVFLYWIVLGFICLHRLVTRLRRWKAVAPRALKTFHPFRASQSSFSSISSASPSQPRMDILTSTPSAPPSFSCSVHSASTTLSTTSFQSASCLPARVFIPTFITPTPPAT